MRVLVTGATGFIGSHAVAACLQRGWRVAALVLPPEAEEYRRRTGGSVEVFPGTLAAPPWDALLAWQPDACLHCAWVATPGAYLHSPLNRDYLRWSRGFLERLANGGVRRLVGVGSCAERLVETMGTEAPLYARCKDELRRCLTADPPSGASCAWARPYYPYGVGEHPDRLPSSVCRALVSGRTFHIRCPSLAKDYVHARDVGAALAQLVVIPEHGTFDVGTGEPVLLRRIGELLSTFLQGHGLLTFGSDDDEIGEAKADCQSLRSGGWAPRCSLEDGLRELAEYWQRRGRNWQ